MDDSTRTDEDTRREPATRPFSGSRGRRESGDEPQSGSMARRSRLGLVPADYAEKTMSSLMSLHEDLMAEKERALEVTRKLMAVQQDRAELESYVRLLEAELQRRGGPSLGGLRSEGGGGLDSAAQTVLSSLASPSPSPPEAVSRAPELSLAVSSSPERPAPPQPEAPRPPRPSAAYRAPVAPGTAETTGSADSSAPVDRPEAPNRRPARSPRLAASGGGSPDEPARATEEAWRQW